MAVWDSVLMGGNTAAVAAAVAALLLALVLRQLRPRQPKGSFPPGPSGSLILGSWEILRTGSAREKFTELASTPSFDKDIIGLRIGCRPTVVVSSARIAKEVLQTHDKIFAHRPAFYFSNTLFYGFDSGVIFSGYTPRFSRLRKLYTLELFSAKRLQELQFIRLEEMRRVLDHLRASALSPSTHQAVNVEKMSSDMSCDITLRLLQSRSLGEQGPWLNELVRQLEYASSPTLGDFIPWLKWPLGVLQSAKVSHLRSKFDAIINNMLRERRELIKSTHKDKVPRDFLQVLLSRETAEDEDDRLTIRDIKAIILDIFSGGIHTSSVTVEWAMSELISNERVMRKLRAHIDALKGEDTEGLVTDEDVANLPYLEDVVKEVFRLHPVVPLLVPRLSTQACQVGKYVLPAGTLAFVNVWAIARDPEVWDRASDFWPERFEGQDLDVKGNHYELLPFGAGRRRCPGMRLGLSIVHLAVANFVRFFDWQLPAGHALDLAERVGRGNAKATHLYALPTPRIF